jgi:AmmeMemoRadiSam system protein B
LYNLSISKNKKMALIGSTDLTHYGVNYDFFPEGSQKNPRKWVESSDKKIIEAMTSLKTQEILEISVRNHNACSAGAAAGAAYFASLSGVEKGLLLEYDTSLSKHKGDSFVGYCSVLYEI